MVVDGVGKISETAEIAEKAQRVAAF